MTAKEFIKLYRKKRSRECPFSDGKLDLKGNYISDICQKHNLLFWSSSHPTLPIHKYYASTVVILSDAAILTFKQYLRSYQSYGDPLKYLVVDRDKALQEIISEIENKNNHIIENINRSKNNCLRAIGDFQNNLIHNTDQLERFIHAQENTNDNQRIS